MAATTALQISEEEDWVTRAIAEYADEGAALTRHQRQEKLEQLQEESTYCYRTGEFEEALQKFAEQIALYDVESKAKGGKGMDRETRAGLVSNIGSCLHLKGDEDDLARRYYIAARDVFAALRSKRRVVRFVFGDVNGYRVAYIDERIELLNKGEKPDTTKYLDAFGSTRTGDGPPRVPKSRQPPTQPAEIGPILPDYATVRSYFSPAAWRAWYRGEAPFVEISADLAARDAEATRTGPTTRSRAQAQ